MTNEETYANNKFIEFTLKTGEKFSVRAKEVLSFYELSSEITAIKINDWDFHLEVKSSFGNVQTLLST